MKDHLKQIISMEQEVLSKLNLAREYLQARILEGLQDSGAFLGWALLGGTALRFLYSLPRYSEDLDFSTFGPSEKGRFRSSLLAVSRGLAAEGYAVRLKVKDEKVVASAFVTFDGLLHELGISPHRSAALSVKVEVDRRPPEGAGISTTIVRKHVTLNIAHHDRPSLLAGKLHAILSRRYTKGRDLYDLIWYLSDRSWPEPNLPFLNAALEQTGWNGPELNPSNWRDVLWMRLEPIPWARAADDVRPFLERHADALLITGENVRKLVLSR